MLAGADNLASGNGRANAESLTAAKRLQAIGDVAQSLDAASIKSGEDATRALCMLELANKCIRIVLRESEGHRNALIEQSDRLIAQIDTARNELGRLDTRSAAIRARRPRPVVAGGDTSGHALQPMRGGSWASTR